MFVLYIHTYLHGNIQAYTCVCLASHTIYTHSCMSAYMKHMHMHTTYVYIDTYMCVHSWICVHAPIHTLWSHLPGVNIFG